MNDKRPLSEKALEMIMRDVLDGLSDFSLQAAYENHDFGMEILAIEPETEAPEHGLAEVIYPPQFRKMVG